MTITRLHPVTLPKQDVSNHDRIMSALTKAIEDQTKDNELGQCARGIAIIFYRLNEDETYGASRIIEGMNSLEAIGLMHIVAEDISNTGLTGGPDHFPEESA